MNEFLLELTQEDTQDLLIGWATGVIAVIIALGGKFPKTKKQKRNADRRLLWLVSFGGVMIWLTSAYDIRELIDGAFVRPAMFQPEEWLLLVFVCWIVVGLVVTFSFSGMMRVAIATIWYIGMPYFLGNQVL